MTKATKTQKANFVESSMEAMSNAGLFAPVKTQAIFLGDGTEVPNKVAVVTRKSPIAVVSNNYNLLPNKVAYERILSGVAESGLDLTDAYVAPSTGDDLRRTLVSIVFPNHKVLIGKNKDETQLRIVGKNSYDGSWPFGGYGGAFRIACANGQVFGDFINAYVSRHNSQLDVEKAASQMTRAAEAFKVEGQRWSHMDKTSITESQALKFLKSFYGKRSDTTSLKELPNLTANSTLVYGMDKFADYQKEMGSTLWAMYNTMTDLTTHRKADEAEDAPVAMQEYRASQVRKVINSADWRRLMDKKAA